MTKGYAFEKMKGMKLDGVLSRQFGSFDLETYQDSRGNHNIYAGGYKLAGGDGKLFYLSEDMRAVDLVSKMFKEMFEDARSLNKKGR